MSPNLVVGAPVRDRDWIIDNWFEHLSAAVEHETPTCTVGVVLVGDRNDPTYERAERAAHRYCFNLQWVEPNLEDEGVAERPWSMRRYRIMAALRNTLLEKVREMEPNLFWSLDTDILVTERSLSSARFNLVENGFDAIGTKLFLSQKGKGSPSYAMLPPNGGFKRPDSDGVLRVDVIMASKLMTPKAYEVDYEPHNLGEDIGWSIKAREAGCKLGWDGTNTSKHVWDQDRLKTVDWRCGF